MTEQFTNPLDAVLSLLPTTQEPTQKDRMEEELKRRAYQDRKAARDAALAAAMAPKGWR